MELIIDGYRCVAEPGMSLLDLVKQLGLDSSTFFERPIAAQIAGEVFNLNYIPVRTCHNEVDRTSIRKAMAASNGIVRLIRYNDPVGKDIYDRTVQFLLFMGLHRLWPKMRAKMNFAVGRALFVEVDDPKTFSLERLKQEVKRLIQKDIPFLRHRITTKDAIAYFLAENQPDKAKLLAWRTEEYFDEYFFEGFADYYYGELAPSSGYVQVWDILPAEGGFMFLYPDEKTPQKISAYEDMPNFLKVCKEGSRWCELMECETVADLNDLTTNGAIRELIRVNEAMHEGRFSQVVDMICQRGAMAVMLAGPSSSGKTTSANRLATQLRVHGKKPILISLDDYYMDRDTILPGPDGIVDYEHINTIDTALFRQQIEKLLSGETVKLPHFNFLTGKREWKQETLQLSESAVIIVEGLHALNPILLPESIGKDAVFKLYVSPLLPLNLDDHNRIPSSLLRLLRRIVRDYETRGSSVQRTMEMWDTVRRGEKLWIFPFREDADVIFNSATLYELAVLKKHIYPLLLNVQPEDSCYAAVRELVKILNYVLEADVDDEVPPTSIVREFIGGNSFYR